MFNSFQQPAQQTPDSLRQTSLLLSSASKGDVAGVKQLLDEGASINSSDYDKRTALHLAASEGHVPVVELLLKRGANANPVDRWGDTPLADARKYARKDVSTILEQHGGRIEDKRRLASFYDDDPSLHYEIDRSELEPIHGVPPFHKTDTQEVRLVNWRGTKVVARTFSLSHTTDHDILNKLKAEVLLLEQMRHPNIVQFLCSITKNPPPVIVTEYLPGGDLHDMLSKGTLPPKRAVRFALDIARGMNYLHEHKDPVVHINLKPKNLLQNEAGQLKVTDFGKLRRSLYITPSPEGDEMGSYLYKAPEVFRKEPFNKSVDTFSFGFILFEVFFIQLSFRFNFNA
ncbi:hypothetical protein M758_1G131600 [Ceratodon purpureus]|nr:hypothetical protein M758_1G131600 [Ceratodon purpureus]